MVVVSVVCTLLEEWFTLFHGTLQSWICNVTSWHTYHSLVCSALSMPNHRCKTGVSCLRQPAGNSCVKAETFAVSSFCRNTPGSTDVLLCPELHQNGQEGQTTGREKDTYNKQKRQWDVWCASPRIQHVTRGGLLWETHTETVTDAHHPVAWTLRRSLGKSGWLNDEQPD